MSVTARVWVDAVAHLQRGPHGDEASCALGQRHGAVVALEGVRRCARGPHHDVARQARAVGQMHAVAIDANSLFIARAES